MADTKEHAHELIDRLPPTSSPPSLVYSKPCSIPSLSPPLPSKRKISPPTATEMEPPARLSLAVKASPTKRFGVSSA